MRNAKPSTFDMDEVLLSTVILSLIVLVVLGSAYSTYFTSYPVARGHQHQVIHHASWQSRISGPSVRGGFASGLKASRSPSLHC